MDVLSDVLGTAQLRGRVFGSLELNPPWGIRASPRDFFTFHILARGRCWLEVDDRTNIHVSTGDVLVLAPRKAHVLRDAPKSKARPIEELIAAGDFAPRGDTDPSATQVVCGAFRVDDDALLASLPTVIHTHELASDAGPWLASTVRLLAYESTSERPGSATVVNRMCDALFVYVIRSVLAKLPADHASWLRAMVTPKIGDALRLIHADPRAEWSVAALAAKVAMSRSAFAERFAEVVGETPMQYVTRWRLYKAASMLRTGEAGIAEIASRVGYQSNVAFTKAFKRSMGTTPGEYRRAHAP